MHISKKPILWIIAIAFVAVACFWLFGSGLEHIPDTNGPEDFSLTTVTDENILNRDLGSIGGPTVSQSILSGDGYEFSAREFTGVYEILYDNYIGKSDFQLDITNFQVTGGNFRMVVIHNDQIVADLTPDMFVTYRLEDITGTVSLRIAGESAAFSFFMSGPDYNMHSHP